MWKCKCTSNYTILHIKSGNYSMFIMMSYFDPLLVLYSWLSEPMLEWAHHAYMYFRKKLLSTSYRTWITKITHRPLYSFNFSSKSSTSLYVSPSRKSFNSEIYNGVHYIEKNYSSRISIHLHIWNMYMFSS